MTQSLPVYDSTALEDIYNFYANLTNERDKPELYKEFNKIVNQIINDNYSGITFYVYEYTYTYDSNSNNSDYFLLLLKKLRYIFPDSIISYKTYDQPDDVYSVYNKNSPPTYTPPTTGSVTNLIKIDWYYDETLH